MKFRVTMLEILCNGRRSKKVERGAVPPSCRTCGCDCVGSYFEVDGHGAALADNPPKGAFCFRCLNQLFEAATLMNQCGITSDMWSRYEVFPTMDPYHAECKRAEDQVLRERLEESKRRATA